MTTPRQISSTILFFEEQAHAIHHVHYPNHPGDGDMDMRMLIELSAISVQGTEDTDFDTLFARPLQHSSGGGAKQGVK